MSWAASFRIVLQLEIKRSRSTKAETLFLYDAIYSQIWQGITFQWNRLFLILVVFSNVFRQLFVVLSKCSWEDQISALNRYVRPTWHRGRTFLCVLPRHPSRNGPSGIFKKPLVSQEALYVIAHSETFVQQFSTQKCSPFTVQYRMGI